MKAVKALADSEFQSGQVRPDRELITLFQTVQCRGVRRHMRGPPDGRGRTDALDGFGDPASAELRITAFE
jgi:hypothetical protein